MQHKPTVLAFAKEYLELGDEVRSQLDTVLKAHDALAIDLALEDGDIHPNALDRIVVFLRNWEDVLGAECVAEDIERGVGTTAVSIRITNVRRCSVIAVWAADVEVAGARRGVIERQTESSDYEVRVGGEEIGSARTLREVRELLGAYFSDEDPDLRRERAAERQAWLDADGIMSAINAGEIDWPLIRDHADKLRELAVAREAT